MSIYSRSISEGCSVEWSLSELMKYTLTCSQAALFFGVEKLLVKCGTWLAEVTSFSGLQSPQLFLDDLIRIWKYGYDHGKVFSLVLKVHDKYVYRRSRAFFFFFLH